jgi:hypothetical protein
MRPPPHLPPPEPTTPGPRASLGGGAPDEALQRFVAEAVVSEAAQARRRRWWRGRQLADESTLAGVLAARSERGDHVVVHTRTGAHSGRLVSWGRDHVVIDTGGASVLVGLAAVVAVEGALDAPPLAAAGGDDDPEAGPDIVGALAAWVEQRPRVEVLGAIGVAGTLEAVGADVVHLKGTAAGRRWLHIAVRDDLEVKIEP